MKKQFAQLQQTTIHFLRWVFFLIFLYIGFTIFWGLWYNPLFFEQVITFSVSGFFAFFMGYFGWRLAQIIEEWFSKIPGKKK